MRSLSCLLLTVLIFSLEFVAGAEPGNAPDAAGDVLFRTSFEYPGTEQFRQLEAGPVEIRAEGTAGITSRFAHTGKHCLHMLGDEGNAVTLTLPEDLQTVRGISFHAERWTRRDPFAFTVEVRRGGEWHEIADLGVVLRVGARFLSHIRLPVSGEQKTTAIRFRATAAPDSGVLIDDLTLHRSPPEDPTPLPPRSVPSEPLELIDSQPLFEAGTHNTHTFRIPAIATATNGDLIAACDARRKSSADLLQQRTIDIVYRRSTDNGRTWSPLKLLDSIDGGGCSDPSLIVDHTTGDIFCFYNYMSADRADKEFRFFLQRSSDHGKTWGEPVDFTDQVAPPELKTAFKFVTSGRGIQTREGRLIHNYVHVGRGATLFGSDDHGKTWRAIGDVSPADESKVVQLADGSLMVNSRVGPGRRHVHRSTDGGRTWDSTANYSLPDPRCNASIIRYSRKQDAETRHHLLFCNAASNRSRKNLAVRISDDGGVTWSDGKVIDPGPAAYSEMTILADGSVGVLYEAGYRQIRFVRFKPEALTSRRSDGEDKP